jgi:hypothetical protein
MVTRDAVSLVSLLDEDYCTIPTKSMIIHIIIPTGIF